MTCIVSYFDVQNSEYAPYTDTWIGMHSHDKRGSKQSCGHLIQRMDNQAYLRFTYVTTRYDEYNYLSILGFIVSVRDLFS